MKILGPQAEEFIERHYRKSRRPKQTLEAADRLLFLSKSLRQRARGCCMRQGCVTWHIQRGEDRKHVRRAQIISHHPRQPCRRRGPHPAMSGAEPISNRNCVKVGAPMSEAQLFEILTEMRLSGAREELEHQLANTGYADMPFVDRMLRMFQAEADRRQRNRIERLTQAAQFKYVNANPEAIDYSKDRKSTKPIFWIWSNASGFPEVRIWSSPGASGTGKTWLASALGNSAVRHEKSTRYVRTSRPPKN